VSATAAVGTVGLFGLEPLTYRHHWLHDGDRTYPETNCYTDLLIELVHAHGDEPLAILGSTARLDFEIDQWTFFKPHPSDLEAILGLDIHEIQPYRSLPDQLVDALADRRTLTIEVDAWYLPDTMATSYRRDHVKTTIAVESIDRSAERLVYFHNTSLFALEGPDYRGVLRLDPAPAAQVLVPYVELVRFDGRARLDAEVRGAAFAALRAHLDWIGPGNPFDRFRARLHDVLPTLLAGDEATYHAHAFATVRMAGAGFELLAAHAEWLLGEANEPISKPLGRIVDGSKLLGFKLARRRPFDPDPILLEMATAWAEAMERLDHLVPAR
jgi:hypothetical protein